MSPKTPRDVSGQQLIKVFQKYNYQITRQKGSHIRMTNNAGNVSHHITVPNHSQIKLGTISSLVQEVCVYLEITKEELYSNF